MKNLKFIFILLVLGVFFVNCNSTNNASKENFTKVINKHLLKKKTILISILIDSNLPITVELEQYNMQNVESVKRLMLYKKQINKYDALVKVELLSVKEGTVKKDKKTIKTKTFSLTEMGKLSFKTKSQFSKVGVLIQGIFYSGVNQVTSIVNFTKPSEKSGITFSKVEFLVSPVNFDKWANSKELLKAFPYISKRLKSSSKRHCTLTLTNDGWVY